ncbi:uncharacterized protein LOC132698174 [Cylas formicarius]|uniref:uncharacterized protein LOC132698174 n=1 Tax=Cylas formicarius TaxID=197179 RepID=UPI0029588CFD|nr:uncharacterized protein LOC132698174 [Cylas formicarius]
MSTVERKEYQETKIMRTVSPVRNGRGSTQDLAQFDSNLDYLLEDLQNSVSRPGSSLGQYGSTSTTTNHRKYNTLDSAKTDSASRVTNVKASNPVTEYSSDDAYNYTSPDGRHKTHAYKKERYMYKTSSVERDIEPERNRMQNSINQLDSLLDDLQQVKKSSYSEKETYNSAGTAPAFRTAEKSVNRELLYGNTPPSSKTRTFERTEKETSHLRRDVDYTGEGTYGDIRPLRATSPSPSSKTSTLTRQTKVANVHEYPLRVVETPVPDIDPEVLAHLDPNLHPPGNTKVTTTIKTYTYEIPGSGPYPTNVNVEKTVDTENKSIYSPNDSITTPSKSFVYNKYENKENTIYKDEPAWKDVKYNKQYKETVTDNVRYTNPPYPKPEDSSWKLNKQYKETVTDNVTYTAPPYQKPAPPGGYTTVKETITTRNYQPGYQPDLEPPTTNQAYYYNESTTTKNIQNAYPQQPPPLNKETYIINKETNVINRNQPPMSERGYPVYNPPTGKSSYILKETHTTNYQNGHPPKDVETFNPNQPPYKKPNEPINIHYSYKSSNTTENRYKGGYPAEDESRPLLPGKFPTNEGPDGPPKRIDELMATIGNEPPNSPLNAGFTAHENELAQQKKIDCLKQQQAEIDDGHKKDSAPPTKNVSGPPVYYPPGHEMFAKKEEGGGGWRAEGAYAKGSGKYMYEAESGSKSKSKSGMAVVPVCLPLCCGLPCTLL